MQTKTKQSNGTYKRPEPEGIAYTVKVMRTYLGWKQLVLAHEAGVNLRTIERVEAGEKVNDDSLRKIAVALKLPEDAFTRTSYSPSEEELAAFVQRAKEDYTHTELHDISSPLELENVLNAYGYLIDGRVVEDEMPDDIVAIKDEVQDSGDIYGDLSHTERLAMCRSLLIRIREIEAHGYRTRWGRYRTDDDFDIGILIFMRATDIQHPEEFRYVVVPRRLCVQLETSWH